MKESQIVKGLKEMIKKKKTENSQVYATEAVRIIKEKNRKIELIERDLKMYRDLDRQEMLGKLNV